MAKRGVILTHETVRGWCLKFGGIDAKRMRWRNPRPGDCWHLDEVFLKIGDRLRYLWRALDQNGEVLDVLVQPRRDKRSAKRFDRNLLRSFPRAIITDRRLPRKCNPAPGIAPVQPVHRYPGTMADVIPVNKGSYGLEPQDFGPPQDHAQSEA